MRQLLIGLAVLAAAPHAAAADTADRLLQLIAIPGVSGYESEVRSAIEMLLPAGARVRADNMGNIIIRTGNLRGSTTTAAPPCGRAAAWTCRSTKRIP